MKKVLSAIVFLLGCSTVFSQSGQWTWVQGDTATRMFSVYGQKGVASGLNRPGGRTFANQWTDAAGNLYLFGGGNYQDRPVGGGMSDLWKYDISSRQWTWLAGDTIPNQIGVYGTKGLSSPSNKPGARTSAACWMDAAGDLWMFGGSGYSATNTSGYLCDLWRYTVSTGQWTWMGGENRAGALGVYETKGVPSATARPGGRQNMVSWKDPRGKFWLYGGAGYSTAASTGYNNDLWMFDPVQEKWTWVNGENSIGGRSVWGSKGVAGSISKPAGRLGATGWTDPSGNLWLFGGLGNSLSGQFGWGYFNDLWRYDPAKAQWSWMSGDTIVDQPGQFGLPGVASGSNLPQARWYANGWADDQGNLWLHGGEGKSKNKKGLLNDLWKYDPASGQWTWVGGDSTIFAPGRFGTRGSADAANKPRAKYAAVQWKDTSGHLWLFSGSSNNLDQGGILDDMWMYSVFSGRWAWIEGDTLHPYAGVYGAAGMGDAANHPGTRYNAVSWTDSSGNLWLFGGDGYAAAGVGHLNDLWKYTPASGKWNWISGDNTIYQTAVYGVKGIPAPGNKPGGRHGMVEWTDAAGNFWFFGGRGRGESGDGSLNDLWKFTPSTGLWAWIGGDTVTESKAVFGSKGLPARTNQPGSRQKAIGWKDTAGNFWLFGGNGYAADFNFGLLSDVWKFTPGTGEWTWMAGSDVTSSKADFGVKGKPAATNTPGARQLPVGWTDQSGEFWLFGGDGYTPNFSGPLDDLWKFSPASGLWTWVAGSGLELQPGNYGTKGMPAPSNKPGGRHSAAGVADGAGNLWLAGGEGTGEKNMGILNDLWKYTPSTGLWTWVSGDKSVNQSNVYGTKGAASPQSTPGARSGATGWADSAGRLWLFGGNLSYTINSQFSFVNDFWQYATLTPLPVKLTSFTASKQDQAALLNWTTAREQGNFAFVVQRSSNGTAFDSIGIKAAAGSISSAASYAFTDPAPQAGNNFYRLKQVDADGKYQYSVVQTVVMDDALAGFALLRNPVQNTLNIRLQLPGTQKLTLEIRDMNGHLLLSRETEGTKGSSVYTLPVQQLASGSYLISILSGTAGGTKTFIKE